MEYIDKIHEMFRRIAKQKILIFLCLSLAINTNLISITYVGFAA
jgi:hypothetical protein